MGNRHRDLRRYFLDMELGFTAVYNAENDKFMKRLNFILIYL